MSAECAFPVPLTPLQGGLSVPPAPSGGSGPGQGGPQGRCWGQGVCSVAELARECVARPPQRPCRLAARGQAGVQRQPPGFLGEPQALTGISGQRVGGGSYVPSTWPKAWHRCGASCTFVDYHFVAEQLCWALFFLALLYFFTQKLGSQEGGARQIIKS